MSRAKTVKINVWLTQSHGKHITESKTVQGLKFRFDWDNGASFKLRKMIRKQFPGWDIEGYALIEKNGVKV